MRHDSDAGERLVGSWIAPDRPGDDNVTRAVGIRSDLPNDRREILAGITNRPLFRMVVSIERLLGVSNTPHRDPRTCGGSNPGDDEIVDPQASDGTSKYSLPKMVMPIFFNPIGLPAAAMTPRSQRPPSVGGGLAAVLDFGVCFLTAGLTAGVPVCVAAVPGAGCACAETGVARHDRTAATAIDRTMKYSGEDGDRRNELSEWTAGCYVHLKLERV